MASYLHIPRQRFNRVALSSSNSLSRLTWSLFIPPYSPGDAAVIPPAGDCLLGAFCEVENRLGFSLMPHVKKTSAGAPRPSTP